MQTLMNSMCNTLYNDDSWESTYIGTMYDILLEKEVLQMKFNTNAYRKNIDQVSITLKLYKRM
jgi:hypothetical protein